MKRQVKQIRNLWEKAEQFWADFFQAKGRRVSGSGNRPGHPGDVRYLEKIILIINSKALLESKQTSGESIRIEKTWLTKITEEATPQGRIPLLGLTIQDERWICIPTWAIEIGGTSNEVQ